MFSDRFVGFVDVLDAERASGWIRDADHPDKKVRVAVFCNDRLLGVVTADQHRADLEAGGMEDGLYGFEFEFEAPIEADGPTLLSALVVDTGETLHRGRTWLPPSRGIPEMAPLLVTGAGRSGTTLLMKRLATSAMICVAPGYPFERMLIGYYANAFRVLTAHADRDHHNDPMVTMDSYGIDPNPFFDGKWYWGGSGPHRIDYLALLYGKVSGTLLPPFAGIIQDYYRIVARETGKRDPVFLCEKNPSTERTSREFARALHPGFKELVLSRDPRDLFMSQLKKFKANEAETLESVIFSCAELVQIKRDAAPNSFFVRYEDLVLHPREELARISAFLGVAVELPAEEEEAEQFAEHGTSASPEASIGRWKTQLPDETADRIVAACGDYMDVFGYAA